jgi:hypothetical protein
MRAEEKRAEMHSVGSFKAQNATQELSLVLPLVNMIYHGIRFQDYMHHHYNKNARRASVSKPISNRGCSYAMR